MADTWLLIYCNEWLSSFFFLLVAASKCGLAISKRRQQHVQHSEVATSHKYNSRCAPCHTVNDVAAHPSIHLMRCDAIGFTLNLLNSGDGSAQSTACRHQSNAANFLRQVVHHAAVSQTPRAPPTGVAMGSANILPGPPTIAAD